MLITRRLLPLLSLSIVVLTGCGGGGESTPESLSGITITSSNAETTIQSGVTNTTKLVGELLDFGGDININSLEQIAGTPNSITYKCGTEGTIVVVDTLTATTISSSRSITYNNCVHSGVHYHGHVSLQNTMLTGTLENLGSYNHTWSAKQTASLSNLSRTAPTSGGTSNIINGDVVLESSNNTNTQIFNDKLTSSNLSFDVIAADTSESSYDFSNLSYKSVEDDSSNTFKLTLDFIANHSEVGHMQLVTEPVLSVESGLLQSGAATFTTGSSTVQFEGIGGNNIRVLLDTDNNGTYETVLSDTTWNALMDRYGNNTGGL